MNELQETFINWMFTLITWRFKGFDANGSVTCCTL